MATAVAITRSNRSASAGNNEDATASLALTSMAKKGDSVELDGGIINFISPKDAVASVDGEMFWGTY